MQKQAVIQFIRDHIEQEIAERRSSGAPKSEMLDPEIQELERALLMYRFLPIREFTPEDVVAPASLTELDYEGRRIWILLVPQHGGLVTRFDGKPVQVLTPQSPLGEALLGKKTGERFVVSTGSGPRQYQVISIL